jgi:hypothetical protein
MKIRIRDNWRAVKDVGWWIGQENPADLRQMEINAIRFVMETKMVCNELRRFYVEVEDGFLRFQGAPFLPVYMVPFGKEKWAHLAKILLKILQSFRSMNWVDRFRRNLRKVDPTLVEEWNNVFRASDPTESPEEDEEEFAEAGEVFDERVDENLHSRLYHLGRVTRWSDKDRASTDGVEARSAAHKITGEPAPGEGDPKLPGKDNQNEDVNMDNNTGDVVFTSVYL